MQTFRVSGAAYNMQIALSFTRVTSRSAKSICPCARQYHAWQQTSLKLPRTWAKHVLPTRLRLCASATESASSVQNAAETQYEAVIGIETHVQLATESKAFCSCKSEYGATPNRHICPVCSGQPGTLPVLNKDAVRLAVLAGLALNCEIAPVSKFDRKQYFYPDLPKGYQISQYDEPLCLAGRLNVEWQEEEVVGKKTKKVLKQKTIGITRAHLEEDAGKNIHSGASNLAGANHSLMDLNRAGVPLLEIVTEPDFRCGAEAAAYGEELRRIVRFLGICDGNMSEGSMRCDVNVSVRPKGQQEFGTKVEVKNMNSFSSMQRAIDFEIARQSRLLREGAGDQIVQETRFFDESKQVTYSMRKKEGMADYRYFPEPDLPPLTLTAEEISAIRDSMPETPAQTRERLRALGLSTDQVLLLAEDRPVADYFFDAVAAGADAKQAANWIQGDLMAWCNTKGVRMKELQFSPKSLAEMIQLIDDATISGKIAKELLPDLLNGAAEGGGVAKLVEDRGMSQITDPAAVSAIIQRVLDANPKQLEQYRGGKTKLQGFFQGQVMKESGGRVNPALLAKMLPEMLKA